MAYGVRASDTQASLRALGEGTGGFMIANSQDYAKPFSRILDNVEAHYELIYRPTENKYDGRLRKIEVKLGTRRPVPRGKPKGLFRDAGPEGIGAVAAV